jgi:hypothetical protein
MAGASQVNTTSQVIIRIPKTAMLAAFREVIRVLKLNKPIVCGASMAGQVCVSVAIRAEEVGAGGTIPLQGCDYLTMDRQFHDKSPVVNQSLFNPDWIYGMMAPKSLAVNKVSRVCDSRCMIVEYTLTGQPPFCFSCSSGIYIRAKRTVSSMATSTSISAVSTPGTASLRSTARNVPSTS